MSRTWEIPGITSSRRWVIRIICTPFFINAAIALARDFRLPASNPAKGSSRIRSFGSDNRARVIRTLRISPLDRTRTARSRRARTPITSSNFSRTFPPPASRLSISATVSTWPLPLKDRASSKRSSRSRISSWSSKERKPIRCPAASGTWRISSPRTYGTSPLTARARIDFPEPFAPRIAQFCPVRISQQVSGRSRTFPLRSVTPFMVMSGFPVFSVLFIIGRKHYKKPAVSGGPKLIFSGFQTVLLQFIPQHPFT
ncbi:MAG: hypothetical protein A4E66_01589 [Syntrophus sp. PtaB.Bin001]|nr:MAG: hypothetical protein A4E66_01589 [Syntrophus sp. PtaB.Bin001]